MVRPPTSVSKTCPVEELTKELRLVAVHGNVRYRRGHGRCADDRAQGVARDIGGICAAGVGRDDAHEWQEHHILGVDAGQHLDPLAHRRLGQGGGDRRERIGAVTHVLGRIGDEARRPHEHACNVLGLKTAKVVDDIAVGRCVAGDVADRIAPRADQGELVQAVGQPSGGGEAERLGTRSSYPLVQIINSYGWVDCDGGGAGGEAAGGRRLEELDLGRGEVSQVEVLAGVDDEGQWRRARVDHAVVGRAGHGDDGRHRVHHKGGGRRGPTRCRSGRSRGPGPRSSR